MILLVFVFGVLLLAWAVAAFVVLATIALAIVSLYEHRLGRPGRFLTRDAQFLRELGIRL